MESIRLSTVLTLHFLELLLLAVITAAAAAPIQPPPDLVGGNIPGLACYLLLSKEFIRNELRPL